MVFSPFGLQLATIEIFHLLSRGSGNIV